jgi:hypothetical protein
MVTTHSWGVTVHVTHFKGPEDAFLQFKGALYIHMQTFHSSNKKTFWGGCGGRLWPPNYGSPMGTRGSPTENPTMELLHSSLTCIFCQRNHPFIPSQPDHSLTCHPSNIRFVHPSGYSNPTVVRLLGSHLYTWGGQSSWHAPHMGVHQKSMMGNTTVIVHKAKFMN